MYGLQQCFAASVQETEATKNSSLQSHDTKNIEGSELAIKIFFKGRAIAKMLHNVTQLDSRSVLIPSNDFSRLDEEIDELSTFGTIKASATSVLPISIPCNVYRDIGFLLDADRVFAREFYTGDADSTRIDTFGNRVEWNQVKKYHCTYNLESEKYDIPCDFSGDFKVEKSSHLTKVESLEVLQKHLSDEYADNNEELSHNEVIIDYTKKSIVGILATRNRNYESIYGTDNERIKLISDILQASLRDKLNLNLPILIFDCLTGKLLTMREHITLA